jgi:hypothetical protein
MLTEKEIIDVLSSGELDLDEVLYGPFKLEDMDSYFKREMKENLLEQGYDLPEALKDPDDDNAPVPDYLKERPDPDTRSRYDGIYDGNQEEEPHFGSALYWQWLAVKFGRLEYLRAYDFDGGEMKLSRKMYWKILVQVYDHLLGSVKNPICHKGYELFMVRKDEIDVDELPEGLAFITVYLF